MQNSSAKRPFKLMLEQNDIPSTDDLFLMPEKRVKKGLSIEILDSFADSSNINSKGFFSQEKLPLLPLLSPKSCKGSRFSLSNIISDHSPSNFSADGLKYLQKGTSCHEYDDFYLEGSFYDVTMRKCHRKTMEDRTVTEPLLPKDKFFAIYDGHSSTYVSDYLHQNFHKTVAAHPLFTEDPKTALKEAFEQVDKKILESENLEGGSTVLCALIRENKLYLANAGDSKAVLITANDMKNITREHRASNEEEKIRVESLGGVIIVHKSRSLVQGSLQITRSIGDSKYKKYISCEPDLFEHDISSEDQMLIMASDGFWDVMTNEEVMEIVRINQTKVPGLSKVLVEQAIKKKNYGLDNISLVMIYLSELNRME